MKAIIIDAYGGSDRLRLSDQPDPTPAAGEVLVRVRAASVNPVDWKICRGDLRLFLHIHFPYTPGGDVAGEVIATGPRRDPLPARRRGRGVCRHGARRRLCRARGGQGIGHGPEVEGPEFCRSRLAAHRRGDGAPIAARPGGPATGGSALINGGAGGVGHFAVQIAKALGAAPTAATCGPANVDFVRSLGADLVIDYSKEDFTRRPEHYDVVCDAVATSSFGACRHLLNPGGAYVTTLPSLSAICWGAAQSAAGLFARASAQDGNVSPRRR